MSLRKYLEDARKYELTVEWRKSSNRAKYELLMIPFLRLPGLVFSTLMLIVTYVMIPSGIILTFIQLGLGAIFIASLWSIVKGLFTHWDEKRNAQRLEKELGWDQ